MSRPSDLESLGAKKCCYTSSRSQHPLAEFPSNWVLALHLFRLSSRSNHFFDCITGDTLSLPPKPNIQKGEPTPLTTQLPSCQKPLHNKDKNPHIRTYILPRSPQTPKPQKRTSTPTPQTFKQYPSKFLPSNLPLHNSPSLRFLSFFSSTAWNLKRIASFTCSSASFSASSLSFSSASRFLSSLFRALSSLLPALSDLRATFRAALAASAVSISAWRAAS